MEWISSDMLTNDVMKELINYIPYVDKNEEDISNAIVATEAYKQSREVYEAVKKRLESVNDGGARKRVLDSFINYPEHFRKMLHEDLSSLIDSDHDFKNRLRAIFSFFIARDQELRKYENFIKGSSPWIWSFTALEGIGKTHLLEQMKERTPNIPVVKFNFATMGPYYSSTGEREQGDTVSYLEGFAAQVTDYVDSQKYKEFEKECTAARLDYNQDVIKQMLQAGNMSDKIREELWQKVLMRATSAFYELMETLKTDHLIIHLDNCEWLTEPVNMGVRRWWIDIFLPALHNKMSQYKKALHVVIMSSVDIKLFSFKDQVCFSKLEPLDKEKVEDYLEKIGVKGEKLRKQFYEMTEGHASCVEILCNLWDQWKKEGKPLPELKEEENALSAYNDTSFTRFQTEFYERAFKKFIKLRVIDKSYLSLQELTEYGIVLREFDEAKFTTIFPEKEEKFPQLIELPCIEQKNDFKYEMHTLFRVVLSRPVLMDARNRLMKSPNKWQEFHERAVKYLEKKLDQVAKLSSYDGFLNHSVAGLASFAQEHDFFDVAIEKLLGRNSSKDLSDWYYHHLAPLLGEPTEVKAMDYWESSLKRLKQENVSEKPLVEAACDKTLMFTRVAFVAQKYRREVLGEG